MKANHISSINMQIQTASQERLLIMLYEGLIKFINQGNLHFRMVNMILVMSA